MSRGRKPKKPKKRQQRSGRAGGSARRAGTDAEFSKPGGSPFRGPVNVPGWFLGQGREPDWWKPSHERVIDASPRLLTAASPRALEQAVAELTGGELYGAVSEARSGLRLDAWAMELTDRLVGRIADTADQGDWQGPWWLLRGLASIGSYGLGGWAEQQAAKAAVSLPSGWQATQPPWLESVTRIRATGDVRAMRDAYGTRFGVIAEFCYPGNGDPSWYLFDIDVSGAVVLAGAGVFDEMDQAAEAWRDAVGVSAEGLAPAPLTPEELTCLVYFDGGEHFISGDESRVQMDNWFRAPRRISELLGVLRECGVDLPAHRSLYHDIEWEPMAEAFTAWYCGRHGHPLGQEVAESLASGWLEGMLPGTEHAVSPSRSSFYRALMGDWRDGPCTDEALAVFPEWVRWHGEQCGVPAHLLDIAVAVAQPSASGT